MTTKMTGKPRPVLHGITAIALLAAGAYFTVELKEEEDRKAPEVPTLAEGVDGPGGTPPISRGGTQRDTAERSWQRLRNPDRSVLRGESGEVLATFTDGARTATLTGPSRTFTEPNHTSARVVTTDWVRLLPKPWKPGAERERWFGGWLRKHLGSERDDLFAYAFQYGDGAPVKKDREGRAYAGDAAFGPLPRGSRDATDRLKQSDFLDYLGEPYTFRDGTTVMPDPKRHRALDCSGYLRTVYGYRARYPLAAADRGGDGLPRTANAMARSKLGTDVIPVTGRGENQERPSSIDALQPGDLVFFELKKNNGGRLDHAGIYLGQDTEGHKIFISSRAEANGPTIGDTGGTSRLDGQGYYASAFRMAKRL